MDRPNIGVFDSGVGGLTVFRRLRDRVPGAHFHYLGDTARVPYGSRSPTTIIEYTREAVGYLRSLGAELIVVACNTASAVAVPILAEESQVPLLGVIDDGVDAAIRAATSGVLVLGTRATIESGVYQRALCARNPRLAVRGLACPLFVAVAEEGWADTEVSELIAKRYLEEAHFVDFDVVLLACTHFPLIESVLRRVVGPDVKIVDPSNGVTDRVAVMLGGRGRHGQSQVDVYVTDCPISFVRAASRMGIEVPGEVRKVSLQH